MKRHSHRPEEHSADAKASTRVLGLSQDFGTIDSSAYLPVGRLKLLAFLLAVYGLSDVAAAADLALTRLDSPHQSSQLAQRPLLLPLALGQDAAYFSAVASNSIVYRPPQASTLALTQGLGRSTDSVGFSRYLIVRTDRVAFSRKLIVADRRNIYAARSGISIPDAATSDYALTAADGFGDLLFSDPLRTQDYGTITIGEQAGTISMPTPASGEATRLNAAQIQTEQPSPRAATATSGSIAAALGWGLPASVRGYFTGNAATQRALQRASQPPPSSSAERTEPDAPVADKQVSVSPESAQNDETLTSAAPPVLSTDTTSPAQTQQPPQPELPAPTVSEHTVDEIALAASPTSIPLAVQPFMPADGIVLTLPLDWSFVAANEAAHPDEFMAFSGADTSPNSAALKEVQTPSSHRHLLRYLGAPLPAATAQPLAYMPETHRHLLSLRPTTQNSDAGSALNESQTASPATAKGQFTRTLTLTEAHRLKQTVTVVQAAAATLPAAPTLEAPRPLPAAASAEAAPTPLLEPPFDTCAITALEREQQIQLLEERHDKMAKILCVGLYKLAVRPTLADGLEHFSLPLFEEFPGQFTQLLDAPILDAAAGQNRWTRKMAYVFVTASHRDPSLPLLASAQRDAETVARLLREKLDYSVRVIVDPDKSLYLRTLAHIVRDSQAEDSIILFQIGNGYFNDALQTGYWLMADSQVNEPRTWVSNRSIALLLKNARARQTLLLVDGIFAGLAANELRHVVAEYDETGRAKNMIAVISSGFDRPVEDANSQNRSVFVSHLIRGLTAIQAGYSSKALYNDLSLALAKELPPALRYFTSKTPAEEAEFIFNEKPRRRFGWNVRKEIA